MTADLERTVAAALEEDLGPERRDLTTELVVPAQARAEARITARAEGVVAGMPALVEVYRQLDPDVLVEGLAEDGASCRPGQTLALLQGRLRSLLAGERVALNFLQQLSGVATMTRRFCEAAAPAQLLDTRKTVPGLRALQRAAVRAGGGRNHRPGLAGAILIKDNHLAAAGGVAEAVRRARAAGLPVEVEVETMEQLAEALAAGADIVLLDNMTPDQVADAARLARGRAVLEVSGGVTLTTAGRYAAAGADRISVGALTHSAPALDISMEVVRTWQEPD
jgi:nicotinate-nucleotide pyrophosphorylase (carboxylating)